MEKRHQEEIARIREEQVKMMMQLLMQGPDKDRNKEMIATLTKVLPPKESSSSSASAGRSLIRESIIASQVEESKREEGSQEI